jgi:excisionase family DNA binding protein
MEDNMKDNDWMSPEEVAERYGIPLGTIYQWRSKGYGPRGVKIGKHVRYRRADVTAWEDEKLAAQKASA